MDISSIFALLTALSWTGSGLLAVYPVQQLGTLDFNRLRMQSGFVPQLIATMIQGGWRTFSGYQVAVLMLSGAIGILISDSLLYASLPRLGPRRNSILFAMHAPITATLGFLILGERLNIRAIAGIVLVAAGVILAIAFGRRARQKHHWESTKGALSSGIAIVLMAALFHSISALIAKPVMSSGVDPMAASFIRVSTAALVFTVLGFLPRWRNRVPITSKLFLHTFGSGLCGITLGMTFLLFALAHGKAGLVATLCSVTPVLILPIMWVLTKERPAAGAWVGAVLAVAGIALILNR